MHGKRFRSIKPDDDGRVHSRVLNGLHIRAEWREPLPKMATILRELGVQ